MNFITSDIKNIKQVIEAIYATGAQNITSDIKDDIEIYLTRLAEHVCSIVAENDTQEAKLEALNKRRRLIDTIPAHKEHSTKCYKVQLQDKVLKLWKRK